MINIIGFKRVIFIAALIAVNAVLGFALYNYLMPQTEKLEREVRTVNSKIATATSDIERMQIEFDQLGQQQNFFNALKEDRFFSTQSRRYAEEVFVQAEQDSGVISATVKVSGGKKLPNEEAEKAEHTVLASPITIELKAVSDVDVYRYWYALTKLFPGHLTLDALTIERKANLNDTILRAISSGREPEMVEASLDLSWRTMVPVSALDNPEGGF